MKMSKTKVALAALTLLLLVSAFAHADNIIYNNGGPNQLNGNEMTNWTQSEEFSLGTANNVTDIHFWDIEAAPGYAGSLTWWITGDSGGNPNFTDVLGTGNTSAVTRVQTTCGILGLFCEYTNDFNITSIGLAANTTYHLVLHNGPITDTTRSEFYWEATNNVDGEAGLECFLPNAACTSGNGSAYTSNGVEHAFYLTGGGQTVPEPGTLLMLGTGLLGAVSTLRRRF
jgi:hypothetical protein